MGLKLTVALSVGTRLGAYEITCELGTGGMGEVYRATDTNLKREVAIKVLPESFGADVDRLARFHREAEVLASLNHPNIAQIHGLEHRDGTTGLVMELVEGPTLADRIAQGPIPPEEALGIAMQIADALEAAHKKGIVHRDLKPANIKLDRDGTAKVLDFGIAKAFETQAGISGAHTPSLTTPAMTQSGILLGTAAYMAPEQARGKPVDQRADIWAFGCVLYEMLTGQPAFGGEDVSVTLARVLERDADMNALPPATSSAVRRTLALCMEKDVKRRIRDVGDVKLALEGAFEMEPQGTAGGGAVSRSLWRRALPLVAQAVAIGGVAVLIAWMVWPAAQPRPVNRFDYVLPKGQALRAFGRPIMALSPDGRRFVYNTTDGLYLRAMEKLDAHVIAGTEELLSNPFFSADGQSVAYWSPKGQLKRIAISGGAAVGIADGVTNLFGASWGSDGTILYGQRKGIFRVSADGGKPELVIRAKEGEQVYGPELLPDGDTVLFSSTVTPTTTPTANWDQAQIVAQSLSTGKRTVLVNGGSDAHYVAGRLIYALGDGLFGVVFDPKTLRVSGGAVPLVQGVERANNAFTAAANYAVSKDGTLVYVSGTENAARRLAWVDTEGHETPVSLPPRAYDQVVLSPDGTHAALGIEGDKSVWIADLKRGTLERLPVDLGEQDPSVLFFSTDGRRVALSAVRDGRQAVVWEAIDGTGAAIPLVTFDASVNAVAAAALSPDGKRFVPTVIRQHGEADLGIATVGDPKSYHDFLATPRAQEFGAAISRDGHWIAYASQPHDTGIVQVYAQRFPEGGGRLAVSINRGIYPHWSAEGNALTYVRPKGGKGVAMVRVAVTGLEGSHGSPTLGTPTELFPYKYFFATDGRSGFDMTADGRRFLMITAGPPGAGTTRVVVVTNWVQELKRLVPAK